MLPPLLQYYTVWTETLVPSPMGKIFGLKHRHHTIVFFGLKLFIAWTRHSLTTETLTVTVTLNTHTQFTVNSNLRYDLHTDIHWQFKPPLWPLHWTHTHIHWQFKPSPSVSFCDFERLRCDHASDRVGVGRGGYNTRQLVAVTMPVTGLGWV